MKLNSAKGRRQTWIAALALPCLLSVSGCDRGPTVAQVSGKVLYKDGSVPQGGVRMVRFIPSAESTAEVRGGASGAIGDDGSFELHRKKAGDGVFLGEYLVTFLVIKGPMDPTPLVAPKYTNPLSTPYKVLVDGDKDDLKFEIEPASGAGR